jgi:hypothetical protein
MAHQHAGQFIWWVECDTEEDMASVLAWAEEVGVDRTTEDCHVHTYECFNGGSTGNSCSLANVPLAKRHTIIRWCHRFVTRDPVKAMMMDLRV